MTWSSRGERAAGNQETREFLCLEVSESIHRVNRGKADKGEGVPGGSAVKNLPASEGDVGSIPGLGRCPGGGNGTPSGTLAWEISWTEEVAKESDTT